MNLAIGAILLAILLIPPLVLLYFFGKGTHARGIPRLTVLEYLLLSAVLSLFLHATVIGFLHLDIDYAFLIQFLSGSVNLKTIQQYEGKYEVYFTGFARYIFWLCAGCALAGYIARTIATYRKFRMSRWLQRFRKNQKPAPGLSYFNNWWYYFRANEYSSRYNYLGNEIPLVYADVLVDVRDTAIMYTGVLQDFVLKDGSLDFIILSNTTKKLITRRVDPGPLELKEGEELLILPEGLLSIAYSNILNLHIRFVSSQVEIDGGNISEPEMLHTLQTAEPEDIEAGE